MSMELQGGIREALAWVGRGLCIEIVMLADVFVLIVVAEERRRFAARQMSAKSATLQV